MEERYAKFIDLIKEVRINVPLIDVLVGMPNYGNFLKDLVSNKSKMEKISDAFLNKECFVIVQNKLPPKLGDPRSFLIICTIAGSVKYLALADLGASINLMTYSLYASLSENTLKPTRMSILLANHTYQYPMGIAENMLIQVGKFEFLADFVILQMEEDDKVPLILGRPFLHTADAIIQPFSTTSEKISESSLNHEFFIKIEEILEQEEEVKNSFEVLPLEGNQKIKNSIQKPPIDLVVKPLPEHLEYAFLEKDSHLLVFISALLQEDEKKLLVSVPKKHKEAFA
uniref:Reverse transcriptase domain-containing protein n=1 Tax=Tanacetum cinerariifolium TaxID=118510 RepID=A0A6L2JA55_TANCI|nr:reverse transcriptase domain-containing protein [Tanacetum cinerariifolium]